MGAAQGRQPVQIQTPDPPPLPIQALKVFEPVFLQFEILGKTVGAKGARLFFFGLLRGVFFLNPCVHTQNNESFFDNSKNG